jgi:hypothetical protein
MMRRKHWLLILAVPLCVLAGDVIYWGIASDRLRAGYQKWLGERLAEGWDVRSAPASIGGWPWAATITVPSATLNHSGSDIPGDLRIVSAGFRMAVSLFHPVSLDLSATGPMHIQIGNAPEIVLTAGECRVSVPMVRTDPLPVGLQARNLRLEAANGGGWQLSVGEVSARVEITADPAAADPSQPAARFELSAEAIGLPPGMKWPLGANISSLALDGEVNGRLPETRDITQWATTWRDGGGSLEITHLTMGWGPLGLTSSATLALDDQLQPMGSGGGRLVGYAETLDRLAGAGIVTRSAATAAKAVLSLLAGTADGDTPSSVDVPLTLQYRTLSMRQVPLVRLPELDWPAH